MAEDSSFLWLRPATEMEQFLDEGNKKGLFVTVYALNLRATVPLSASHVRAALQHTFRKIPSMRMCFRTRGEDVWACDMNREELDFKEADEQDLTTAVESLLQYHFPTTKGPLWCARLLPQGAADKSALPPDLADSFPHSRTLLLANHHGIADGTTNIFMVNAFLGILDDIISSKPIDDTVQLGRLVAGEETKAIFQAKVDELKKNEALMQKLRDEDNRLHAETKLIPRAYPLPKDPNFKPQMVVLVVDKEITLKFIKKCKKEGVTVNSGFTAIFNTAIVDLVRLGGFEQETYNIHELHTVSMRRYWSGDTKGTLGVHMMIFQNFVSTPAKWRDNFWEYARIVHKNLSKTLKEKENAVLYLVKTMDHGNPEDHFKERPDPECDYGSANMGDADKVITTKRENLCLGQLVRVTSCWNDPMYLLYHTIHGSLTLGLTYANDVLNRENAQKLMDIIKSNMEAMVQE